MPEDQGRVVAQSYCWTPMDCAIWPWFSRLRLFRDEDGCCQPRYDEGTGLGVERRLANDRVGGMLLHHMQMQFQSR